MNGLQHQIATARRSVDIDLPLDPETDNVDHVALLVRRILQEIDVLTAGRDTTPQDIVQSLRIAAALHAALGDVRASTGQPLTLELLDVQPDDDLIN